MSTKNATTFNWNFTKLLNFSKEWYAGLRNKKHSAGDNNPIWFFNRDWKTCLRTWLIAFKEGKHQFSPIKEYKFPGETIRVWSYPDRLMQFLILNIIKPTFKHILSPYCLHLYGPSIIKNIEKAINVALHTGRYFYCLRMDIKSFYASIEHKKLIQQLKDNFNDPILIKYFEDIITAAIDCEGNLILPKKGIQLRSSLSPFLGALYLTKLDRAFENCPNLLYYRYMDDIIILVENKRQYTKSRKKVFNILKDLKLSISPSKTRMGEIKRGFHFLGIDFSVSRNQGSKNQEATNSIKVSVDIHTRTCRRATDKALALIKNAVHPAMIQRYLSRWAHWWSSVTSLEKNYLLYSWVSFIESLPPESNLHKLTWCGRGLLLGSDFSALAHFSKLNQ